MSTEASSGHTEVLRHAATRAGLAPSVHNTQPWRFRIGRDTMELRADPDRRLRVLDPTGRQLMISLGCALFNARVALASSRVGVAVHRLPDTQDEKLIARIELTGRPAPWTPLVRLEPAIDRRFSNRRDFFEKEVPEEILYELTSAATAEHAILHLVESEEHRQECARLLWEAEAEQTDDPDYRAELHEWITSTGTRQDGVSTRSFPMAGPARGEIPIRDFSAGVTGLMPAVGDSDRHQCLMILGSKEDSLASWLHAGEALERLWLEATRLDYVASLFTQVIEVPELRAELRNRLELDFQPVLMLRVGQAAPNVATNRRDPNQLIEEM
ncbi:MAG: hypothetical protein L0H41_14075 [Microlunatus sp.]|nr:hypothetical protein [Microlunatus sp.]MDN5769724.1 hypothetical protein [Microlunatus sp.]MDN5804182.1 hypothetical protein [Microlunatus sp.]